MPARPDWGALGAWALGFLPVAYLGLDGGGYDPLVHDQVGIAVWWMLLLAVLVGALPRRRLAGPALVALGLLAALAAWTALSLTWTESIDKTSAELARAVAYLGVFALASTAGGGQARRIAGGVATAIVCVAAIGLLSRLHPAWFPAADETAAILGSGRERLSYPLHYWNALAALIAVGMPLVLQAATRAKSIALRGLAAAALPAMALTAYFTLSRGGIAAAIVALVVFLSFTSDRLPALLTLGLGGAGGALLIAAATRRDALEDGLLTATAERQGDELLLILLVVCLTVGLLRAGAARALGGRPRPGWTVVSRRRSLAAVGVTAVVLAAALGSLDASGKAADAWSEFKRAEGPGRGAGRLESAAGQGRYQLWSAAADQNATRPLTGTGAGTFEYWWARNGDDSGTVLDAHSLYLQTLGELGIVGLALLASFMLTVLVSGARHALRADPATRSLLAATLAGCAAFVFSAGFDWHWQIPALPIAMLLLAAILVGGTVAEPAAARSSAALRLPLRFGLAVLAIAAIAAIAVPLASTSLLRQSEAEARRGELRGALESARSAQNVQPGAASPRLQQALVLEEMGELTSAAAAARAATEREATNWRPWLVLARLEAERGRASGAVRAYLEARSLNPHASLFARG